MKITNTIKTGLLIAATLFTISSCSVDTKNIEIEQTELKFDFEDIDEGSNMIQIEVESGETFYSNKEITADNIQKATITLIEITKNDSLSFSEIENVQFSISGDENEMLSIALLNTIPEDSKTITLELTEEIDITPYINEKEGVFYLTIDASFTNED